MDNPQEQLTRMIDKLQELLNDRREYEQNDALEGVIECNSALSEIRLAIKEYCATHELVVPRGV